MKCGPLMGALSILLELRQSLRQSLLQVNHQTPRLKTTLRSLLYEGVGAEEIAVAEIIGEVAVPDVAAETPTIKIIRITVKTKIIPPTNHTKEVLSIRIYLPVLAGPAPNIGRKVPLLHTVQIHWSANGSTGWPHANNLPLQPEKLASLI